MIEMTAPSVCDEAELAALRAEIAAYVTSEGEQWASLIERTRAVPPGLREELRERGYLSLASPAAYGGRGIPFARYLELLELFSMSHASLRMIVHVANGIWRAIDQLASQEQRERFVLPAASGASTVAFTLTEPDAGSGADLALRGRARGRHLPRERPQAPDHVRALVRLLAAVRPAGRHERPEGTVALMVAAREPRRAGSGHGRIARRARAPTTRCSRSIARPSRWPTRLGQEGDGLAVAFGGFLTPSRIAVARPASGWPAGPTSWRSRTRGSG